MRREDRNAAGRHEMYNFGDVAINKDHHEVTKNGKHVDVTYREFQLLVYLAENAGKMLKREEIFDAVWGHDYADIGSVTVTIKNLRDKIDAEKQVIRTVWGVGYQFVPPTEAHL